MRIAFYAPLKSPTHSTPSGDWRVAGLLMEALEQAGHRVELVSSFRSYERDGDAERQSALRQRGEAIARRMAEQWRGARIAQRPDLWFTYHVYYKAPDWLGPIASEALGIPYVIAEASYAPKRAGGPWAIGHDATVDAIRRAALVLSPTRYDLVCLEPLVAKRDRLMLLPPFLNPAPFRAAGAARAAHRSSLGERSGLDPSVPWIVVAAMMRNGDKLASYRALAAALARVDDLPWRLVVAGNGVARSDVEAAFEAAVPGRAHYLGELGLAEVAAAYAACDLCAWPAVNEAYGMALLEAQATGTPVVSCALRGVPDVVEDGKTGLLAPPGDDAAFAQRVRELLTDARRRRALGEAAAAFVAEARSVDAASARLAQALGRLTARATQS